jgi:hypothetical protein
LNESLKTCTIMKLIKREVNKIFGELKLHNMNGLEKSISEIGHLKVCLQLHLQLCSFCKFVCKQNSTNRNKNEINQK